MIVLNVLVLTLILSAGARPLDGDSALPDDVLVLFHVQRANDTKNHVVLVVQPEYEDSRYSDPNILLMMENFQQGEWDGNGMDKGAPRLTRAQPAVRYYPIQHPNAKRRGSVVVLSSRSGTEPLLPPVVMQPPPVAINPNTAQVSKIGRSINTADLGPNHSDVSDDETSPDFLSSLVTIPQVWMHDLGHMIIQPLRKDKNPVGERDSFEYFGMVGKAPYITCPIGFKKNTLGTCRPVFRSKRAARRR